MLRNSTIAAAVTALDETMRREAKRHLWWSRFMGNVQKVESYNNDTDFAASGKPIEVQSLKGGPGLGDRMLIPMLMELAGLGRLGDAVMLGNEEDFARKYAMIHYNQIRHAVPVKKGKKDYSNEEILRMMEYCQPLLSWWHAQRENWEIISSIYLGAGEALTTGTTDATFGQGLGIDKRVHPNLYTHSSDVLTRIGTAGKYPTMAETYTAINGAAGNGDDFATDTLRLARKLVYNTLYMKPMFTISGNKYWGILVDPAQADTLRADAMFISNGSSAPLNYSINEHPDITGSIGVYGNFVVFEDPVAVRGYTTLTAAGAAGDPNTDGSINVLGSTTAVYDETDKANPRFLPQTGRTQSSSGAAYANHGAIIIGGSMLGKADYDGLSFQTEEFDYANWKGISAGAMYGYERLDFIPEVRTPTRSETTTASATNVYNRSSAIILTFQAE